MYHILLIHSYGDGHLGCFNLLVNVNNAALKTGVQESMTPCFELYWLTPCFELYWLTPCFELFGLHLEVELLGYMVIIY